MKTNKKTTKELVITAMFIALIVALQSFSSVAARLGLFSFALGLFPATIGSILFGKTKSLIFGGALGVTILATDATAYALYGVNIFATILVVLLKSVASTFVIAVIFDLIGKYNRYVASVVAGIVGPIVNTAIFTAGVCIFFKDFFSQYIGEGVTFLVGFILMILANFIIEVVINIVLSPIAVRISAVGNKA